jgi:hypothetical protein
MPAPAAPVTITARPSDARTQANEATMKRLLLGLGAVLVVGAAVAWSGPKGPRPAFDFAREKQNPVSNFRFNNAPDDFQFAVVSDRTGGHRAQVFSRAVERINLMQPEFVVCVGDLIEGYSENTRLLDRQWREFQGYVGRLQMPFFYVPGNHDIANKVEDKLWREKFGRRYYEFVYRDVLFLALNSEDTPGTDSGIISAEQLAWLKKTLADNAGVRWTFVFLHKPMWVFENLPKNGWLEVEKLLQGRPYTVFCGHVHVYQKFVRQGQNYYMLATTGGASKMRGVEYGEFDHIAWVTMKKGGPVLANLLLDGILPEDLNSPPSDEDANPIYNRKPTYPVSGEVLLNGRPVAGAYVEFIPAGKAPVRRGIDALAGPDGKFKLSTYTAGDGAPAGAYAITVQWRGTYFDSAARRGPNKLPAVYADPKTSGLSVRVVPGDQRVTIALADPPPKEKKP